MLLVAVVQHVSEVSQLPGRHCETALHGGGLQQGDYNPSWLAFLTHRSSAVQGFCDLAPQGGNR